MEFDNKKMEIKFEIWLKRLLQIEFLPKLVCTFRVRSFTLSALFFLNQRGKLTSVP